MCQAASLLADSRPDVLVWAGTAGLWRGLGADRALCDTLAELTSVPAVTTGLALVEACRSLGARRVALVTPYLGDVVSRIVMTLAEEGVAVTDERHLGLSDNHAFGLVPPDEVLAMALDCTSSAVDAVLIGCTNMSAAGVAGEIERRSGAVVLDSIAVSVWWALKTAGVTDPGQPQRPGHGATAPTTSQIGGS